MEETVRKIWLWRKNTKKPGDSRAGVRYACISSARGNEGHSCRIDMVCNGNCVPAHEDILTAFKETSDPQFHSASLGWLLFFSQVILHIDKKLSIIVM